MCIKLIITSIYKFTHRPLQFIYNFRKVYHKYIIHSAVVPLIQIFIVTILPSHIQGDFSLITLID